ncbi:MAG: glucose-6-phosphate isomerase [Gammaproteobacteria bacterium]|nr:MAG: glucose-6-phosphate isomerase [Gammaproteobacteria bacterium]
MIEKNTAPETLATWKALRAHQKEVGKKSLRELFAKDRKRAERFSVKACGIRLDYSRHLATRKTIKLLAKLAREAGVEDLRDRMFAGDHINTTEDRAVLHVALRSAQKDRFRDGDQDCTADVHEVLDKMERFVQAVHSGEIRGYGSRLPFTDVVNIGIGGSDLGIEMALKALHHHRVRSLRVHTVSNIDGTQLADVLEQINPRTTLFVICSKTFTTQETLTNARAARNWLLETVGEEAVARNFAAVSTNHEAMDAFGIHPDYRFGFWDWVGGRYSVWSAVGLSVALGLGMKNFRAFLAGGRAMDRHFRRAPPAENLPMLLALLSIWYNDFFGASSQAILPYDARLGRFPAFLQQMHMESNGKSVRKGGKPLRVPSGNIIWGEAGNNAQHSFYQLLHQGSRFVPVDFIAPDEGSSRFRDQHRLGLINMRAQAEALAFGQTAAEVRADLEARGMSRQEICALAIHKVHRGNRPSTLIRFRRLDPKTMGKLVALYEHKVFTEGAIWDIDSFDQWGVELGKKLAQQLESAG